MFVYTAKLNKKRLYTAVIAVILIAAAILAICIVKGSGAVETLSTASVVKTNEQRVEYLENLGWQVDAEPIEEQTILIPTEFGEVYLEYNTLQTKQGFDLTKYSGCEAVRYTYSVLNHPTCTEGVVADIIVYRGRVIAGDVQSVTLDGFMSTLDYPKTA